MQMSRISRVSSLLSKRITFHEFSCIYVEIEVQSDRFYRRKESRSQSQDSGGEMAESKVNDYNLNFKRNTERKQREMRDDICLIQI